MESRVHGGEDIIATLSGRVSELSKRVALLQAELESATKRLAVYEENDATIQDALSGALRAAYQIRERAEVTASQILEQAREERRMLLNEIERLRAEHDSIQDEIATQRRSGLAAVASRPLSSDNVASELRSVASEALKGLFQEIVEDIRSAEAARPAPVPLRPEPAPPVQAAPRAEPARNEIEIEEHELPAQTLIEEEEIAPEPQPTYEAMANIKRIRLVEEQQLAEAAAAAAEAERAAVLERAAAAERAAAERAEAERIEAERAAAERAEAERLEAERAAAKRAEAERIEAERVALVERAAAAQREADAARVAAEQRAAEAERALAKERAAAAEQAEAARREIERTAAALTEAERAAAEARSASEERAAEAERALAEERAATAEQAEAARHEMERTAAALTEAERAAAEARSAAEERAAEAERRLTEERAIAAEQAEAARREVARAAAEREAAERALAERAAAERAAAAQRAGDERAAAARRAADERTAADRAAADRAAAERVAAERAAAEALAAPSGVEPARPPLEVLLPRAAEIAPPRVEAASPTSDIQLVLSPIASFPRLVEIERHIQSMTVVRTLYVRDFRGGRATLAVSLRSPMTPEEFAGMLAGLMQPRMRLVSGSRNLLELRIEGEAGVA